MAIGKGFSYITRNPQWVKKVFIGSIITAILPNLTKRDEPILTGLAAVKVMLRPVRSHDRLSSS